MQDKIRANLERQRANVEGLHIKNFPDHAAHGLAGGLDRGSYIQDMQYFDALFVSMDAENYWK